AAPGENPLLRRRRSSPEPELLDGFARLGNEVVDRRIVREEADLELRRGLDELLHVLTPPTHDWYRHRNMTDADADVLLRIRVEVDHDAAAGFGGNRTTEASDVALLEKPALNFGGPYVLELVHAHHREVLVQRVRATPAGRFPVV